MESARGWPWGRNAPARRTRLVFASLVALVSALLVMRGYIIRAGHHSDFSAVWIGARLMLEGSNPYPIVGPGLAVNWPWELRYPGPAFVVGIPFALLPEWLASGLFSGVSAFLLAWGMTRESWHRIPALASGPFLLAVSAGQWSTIYAASWFIPSLAFLFAVKPTSGLAAFLYSPSKRHRINAVIGGVVLIAISLALLPSWPADWIHRVRSSADYSIPLLQPGGFLVALALVRWKMREAWVVFLLALMPQAHSIYDILLLLVLVPQTYREAILLSGCSSVGFYLMTVPANDGAPYLRTLGILRIVTCYLPAVAVVLLRRAPAK